jgi:hypothetical protein
MRTAYITATAATAASVAALAAGLSTDHAAPSASALPLPLPLPPVASSHTWMSIPPADPRGAGAILIRSFTGNQTRCVDTHAWRA